MMHFNSIVQTGTKWIFLLSTHMNRQKKDEVASTELQHLTSASPSVPQRRSAHNYTKGWRFGAISCAVSAFVVFIVNLTVTIIWGTRSQSGVLFEGDCDRARKINSGLHLLINALSTVLLSSSNYCMQCLSAPTRNEIDVAHARGKWLDIGVLSIRNLRGINKKRVMIWYLLGLSSLPLHLFYNSAVYMSIAAYDYEVYGVGQSFVDSSDCPSCGNITRNGWLYTMNEKVPDVYRKAREGRLERLENIDCINAYAPSIQSNRGDLLLVTKDADIPLKKENVFSEASPVFWHYSFSSYIYAPTDYNPTPTYKWICSSLGDQQFACFTDIDLVRTSAANWTVGGSCIPDYEYLCENVIYMRGPIQYCLSEKLEPKCEVQWSTPIAALVTALNLLKAIVMIYTAFGIKEEPLMTMGDAIASFLQRQDPSTVNMCLASVEDMKHAKQNFNAGPRRWIDKRFHWRDATSKSRRIVTFLILSFSVITISSLLGYGIHFMYETEPNQSRSLTDLARIGFGTLDTRTIIQYGIHSIIGNTLVANVAQVILSIVYFSYNSLFTCMLLGREWASYTHRRKGLRVSTRPMGAQRSTYFLSLPYRFALPLMVTSGLLHWLVSQSIFFVAIQQYSTKLSGERYENKLKYSCGYSPIAMVSVIVVASILLIIGIGVGFIPYRPGTNLVGSCSTAMSAACHLSPSESSQGHELILKKIQWGVTNVRTDGAGHCSFSDGAVEMPKRGEMYAGL